jgi:hypothetical protein
MSASEIRDAISDWIDFHKDHCDDAECDEPANLMAFLLHCAGIRADKLQTLQEPLQMYEAQCPNCAHLRN